MKKADRPLSAAWTPDAGNCPECASLSGSRITCKRDFRAISTNKLARAVSDTIWQAGHPDEWFLRLLPAGNWESGQIWQQ